jgi:hypothetical protein
MMISLTLSMPLLLLPASAGAQTPTKFEGIWAGPQNVTLIKELKGYAMLQGMDKMSAWSARCVADGDRLVCRGSGAARDANESAEFAFESTVTRKGSTLSDDWKATFPAGKVLQGVDTLRPLELEKIAPARN